MASGEPLDDDDEYGPRFDFAKLAGLPSPAEFLAQYPVQPTDDAWIDAVCSGASSFNLKKFLEQPVLYYPGGGHDFCPLWLFYRHAGMRCFAYADWGHEFHGVPGFQVLFQGEITPQDLGVHDWKALWSPELPEAAFFPKPATASGKWSVLHTDTQSDRPIILIYLKTEAIQTYRVLWREPGAAPDAIVLQDHRFAGNWTEFGARGCMYQYANPHHLPRLLYIARNTEPWPGFDPCSDFGNGEGQDDERHGHRRSVFRRSEC